MHVKEILDNRIMVLDGAMGTMIQQYGLTEKDFRGERFSDIGILQKGNNDLLCLTQPQIITAIHQAYLDAGADIIETNSFNSTRISMTDYGMQGLITEINFEAARLARNIADDYTRKIPDKPRFVAGSVGPTNKTCSMSPDVNNPAFRALTFDDLADAYREQITALIDGGVDFIGTNAGRISRLGTTCRYFIDRTELFFRRPRHETVPETAGRNSTILHLGLPQCRIAQPLRAI